MRSSVFRVVEFRRVFSDWRAAWPLRPADHGHRPQYAAKTSDLAECGRDGRLPAHGRDPCLHQRRSRQRSERQDWTKRERVRADDEELGWPDVRLGIRRGEFSVDDLLRNSEQGANFRLGHSPEDRAKALCGSIDAKGICQSLQYGTFGRTYWSVLSQQVLTRTQRDAVLAFLAHFGEEDAP